MVERYTKNGFALRLVDVVYIPAIPFPYDQPIQITEGKFSLSGSRKANQNWTKVVERSDATFVQFWFAFLLPLRLNFPGLTYEQIKVGLTKVRLASAKRERLGNFRSPASQNTRHIGIITSIFLVRFPSINHSSFVDRQWWSMNYENCEICVFVIHQSSSTKYK